MSDITDELLGLVHDALCHRCGDTGTGFDICTADLERVHAALRARYPRGITATSPPRPDAPRRTVEIAISPGGPQIKYLQQTQQRRAGCRPCGAARLIADELAGVWDPHDNWSETPSPFRPGATLLDDVVHTTARVLHQLTAGGAL